MPDWAEKFLEELRAIPNVSAAAAAAGISRPSAYDWRERCPEFRIAWDAAIDASLDRLEQKVFRRAEETSDTLAIFLLKSHRPTTYGDRVKVDHTHEVDINWGDPTQGQHAAAPPGAASGPGEPGAV